MAEAASKTASKPKFNQIDLKLKKVAALCYATDELLDDAGALEAWLNRYCGSHYSEWAYHNGTSVDYWQACIAFRRERNKTLFLLTWA
jgi:hypothetical protein